MNNKNNSIHKIREFTDLNAWQEKLVIFVHKITKSFPKEETYPLTDQMRRVATSVTSNIAERFGRQSYKENVQFYYLAQGSLIELKKPNNYCKRRWLLKRHGLFPIKRASKYLASTFARTDQKNQIIRIS